MSDRTHVHNLGVAGEPLPQGYELLLNRHVAADGEPDEPYDPFGDGTQIHGCPECGATWNADDLHLETCSRRRLLVVEYALSLWQPWADLCVIPEPYTPWMPVKPVENRGWRVPSTLGLPIRIGIHAAKKVDRDGLTGLLQRYGRASGVEERAAAIVRSWSRWSQAKWSGNDHSYDHRLGALVGHVTVTGCHHADECQERTIVPEGNDGRWPLPEECDVVDTYCSRWAQPGQYHWILADPEPIAEPIPMRGRQKLWRLPTEEAADG